MSVSEIAAAVIVFVLAAGWFVLGIRHFAERGFLLNNAYIYASEKERERMDKKPYYRQSAVVFFLLGAVFVLIGLSVVLQNDDMILIEVPLVLVTLVYAVVSSVRISRKHRHS